MKEYIKLEASVKYKDKVEPLLYVLYLVLGVVFACTSLLWVLHLILNVMLPQHYEVINYVFIHLTDNQLSVFTFVLYTYLAFFLLFATFSGNVKFGMRFGAFTFHALM